MHILIAFVLGALVAAAGIWLVRVSITPGVGMVVFTVVFGLLGLVSLGPWITLAVAVLVWIAYLTVPGFARVIGVVWALTFGLVAGGIGSYVGAPDWFAVLMGLLVLGAVLLTTFGVDSETV